MVIARFRGILGHSRDLTARLEDDEIKSHEISVLEGVLFKWEEKIVIIIKKKKGKIIY